MKADMEAMLDLLGLPKDATAVDFVFAVRRQQTERILTSLDQRLLRLKTAQKWFDDRPDLQPELTHAIKECEDIIAMIKKDFP